MKTNERYQGTIYSIEKNGKSFTSTNGIRYTNYKVRLHSSTTYYQMAIPSTRIIDIGDEIRFTLKVDKRNKLRLYDVELVSYDIKYPLKPQPSDLFI
jgi:hypothetical protein